MADEWFWVRLKNGYSLPAVRDGQRWSNTDTWEDSPGEVLESEPIPLPSWTAYGAEKLPEIGQATHSPPPETESTAIQREGETTG